MIKTFGPSHYVPILKGKEGEYKALGSLDPTLKASMTPLIEVVPEPSGRDLATHLRNTARKMHDNWGTSHPIMVDLRWQFRNPEDIAGIHPLEHMFVALRNHGVKGIPVTGLSRSHQYQAAVQKCHTIDNRGVSFRIEPREMEDLEATASQLYKYIQYFGVSRSEVDIIIDFRAISTGQAPLLLPMAHLIINSFPDIHDWRTFTLSASSFPMDLSQVPSNSVSYIERTEWALWKSLYTHRTALKRLPAFGDYAISHPDLAPDIDGSLMNMSANVRYTATDNWVIFKGYGVKTAGRGGYSQFSGLSQQVIAHSSYSGPNFSYGDKYIYECAQGNVGTGNATTWRLVGTNHHITFLTDQLANFSWP